MKKLLLVILLMGACLQPVGASLNLVSREPFQGVGTLNSALPGNLGAVSGSFYKRAVGPKLVGDTTANGLGWSADLHAASEVTSTLTLAAPADPSPPPNDIQCFDCWVYVNNNMESGNSDVVLAYLNVIGKPTPLFCVSLGAAGAAFNLTTYQYSGATPTSAALNLNTWYEVRLAWNLDSTVNYTYDVSVLYRAAGAANFTTLYDYTGIPVYNYLGSLVSGCYSDSTFSSFNGRIGMPSLYNLDAFTDRTLLVSDVTDPPSGPYNWYVNPVTGNDNNDGTTAGTAWQSVGKINTESLYCGMFPAPAGYASGDTLNVNGATGPGTGLVLGTASLNLNTQGLNLIGHDSPYSYVQAEEIMAEPWTLVSGSTTIWQCALSTVDPSCVMWEDDKWLNHPTGTAYAGAVATFMAATNGSYWTDGTTMYYRPFVDSNPNTDGKVKTRSYNRGGVGNSAIVMLAPELHIQGLKCRKTALADENTNDPINAYCLQSDSVLNGASLIQNCYFDYGSKHILGFTDVSTSRAFTVQDVTVDQCQPYFGGSPLVDYSQLSGPLTNTTTYLRVSNPHVLGLIGSTTGNPTNGTGATWLSHSGGLGDFANITMTDCNFAGYLESDAAESSMTITGTTCGAIISSLSGTGTMTVDRCKTTAAGITNGNGTCNTRVTNSIIAPTQAVYTGGPEYKIEGNITFKGCTFDLSNLGTNGPTALYYRSAALQLTMQNCVVLLNQANSSFGFLANATGPDSFAMDHNLYQTAGDAGVIFSYYSGTNRTLADLVALNIEQASSHDEPVLLTADYLPENHSPAINGGVNLNPPIDTDYSGTVFATRETIGAYEPLAPDALGGTVVGTDLKKSPWLGHYTYSDYPLIYQYNLGYEYIYDAGAGFYFYDYASGHFWYTQATYYPFVYDFSLATYLYYYNGNGSPRYFFDYATNRVISQ